MKYIKIKSIRLAIWALLLVFAFFTASSLFNLNSSNYSHVMAYAQEYTGEESNLEYLELYSEDGTMEMVPAPANTQNNNQRSIDSSAENNFEEVKLLDSGKPDSESIVITIMGDGFTENQQNEFIEAAINMVDAMLGNPQKGQEGCHPFNLFREYFTVYAIKVISAQSGVSRDADVNNGNIVDNYFGSSFYYGDDESNIERALVITNKDKARALMKPNSSMTAIICNSGRWGGTGGEFAVSSTDEGYENIMLHEFGHSFGKLADEYYYPEDNQFLAREAANMTRNNDANTIKWKEWLGINNVGIYPYSANIDEQHGSHLWFKPSVNCKMQYSSREFCAVCATELTRRMAALSGETFYGKTSNDVINIPNVTIPADETRILHYAFSGNTTLETIEISESVQTIGDYAFLGASGLTTIINKSRIPQEINESTFAGLTLSDITVYIPEGKVDAYRNAGWTDFNMVEMPLFKTNDTGSTIIGLNYIPSGDVVIPNVINGTTITSISSEVFLNCSELESVILPATLTMMGDDVFAGCTNLEKVIVSNKTTIPSIGTNCFANIEDLTIYVSYSLENLFEIATNWHAYANDITGCYFDEDGKVFLMEDKITSVAQRAGLITLSSFDFDDVWADPELYLINEAFIAVGGGRIFYVAFDYNFNLGEVIECTLKIEVDAQTSCLLFDGDQEFVEECFIEDGILTIPYTEIYNNGGEFYLLPLEFYVQPIEFEITDIMLEYTVKVYI